MKKRGRPLSVVTGGLCCYPAAMKEIGNACVASQTRRLDQYSFGQRLDGVELEAGENPSCSRQYKFKRPKESPICVGSSEP